MGRKKKIDAQSEEISAEELIQLTVIDKFIKENTGWELQDREYDVVPMMKGLGKGDLVFFNKQLDSFHVIECKNHSTKETLEQAEYYASWVKIKHPSKRVTYQCVVVSEWSIIYDMDLNKSVINTLTKIHTLKGLTKNELATVAQIYSSLYLHRNVFSIL